MTKSAKALKKVIIYCSESKKMPQLRGDVEWGSQQEIERHF